MAYEDKTLSCLDCGTDFTFSASEQERFAQLGFENEPKRCRPCRAAKKGQTSMGGGGGGRDAGDRGAPREFTETKCAECGGPARVPFKPRGDRPVYCSDCFSKRR